MWFWQLLTVIVSITVILICDCDYHSVTAILTVTESDFACDREWLCHHVSSLRVIMNLTVILCLWLRVIVSVTVILTMIDSDCASDWEWLCLWLWFWLWLTVILMWLRVIVSLNVILTMADSDCASATAKQCWTVVSEYNSHCTEVENKKKYTAIILLIKHLSRAAILSQFNNDNSGFNTCSYKVLTLGPHVIVHTV